MELLCVLMPLVVVAITVAMVFDGVARGHASAGRWGSVAEHAGERGDGAFRTAALSMRRQRDMPASVWIAGVGAALLAPLIGFVCAPIGLVGALWMQALRESTLAGVLLGVSLSGFLLAFQLGVVARRLLSPTLGCGPRVLVVGAWSALQHLVTAVAWDAFIPRTEASLWVHVPAAICTAHAVVMIVAGVEVQRIHAQLTEEEREALATPPEEPPAHLPPCEGEPYRESRSEP